jgi:hypothetical protein
MAQPVFYVTLANVTKLLGLLTVARYVTRLGFESRNGNLGIEEILRRASAIRIHGESLRIVVHHPVRPHNMKLSI